MVSGERETHTRFVELSGRVEFEVRGRFFGLGSYGINWDIAERRAVVGVVDKAGQVAASRLLI